MDRTKPVTDNKPAIGRYDIMIKLLIIGDSSVGKTCLLQKFCDGIYSDTHIATIGIDFKIKTIDVENKKIKMQIWDTAGQEKFKSIVQTYYKGAMGIIVVYSIGDKRSFANVEAWMKQIKQNAAIDIAIILVGNKSDLPDRQVETSEGEELARKHKIKFFETSAKEGYNVNQAFMEIAKEIKDRVGEDPNYEKKFAHDSGTGGVKLRLDNLISDQDGLERGTPGHTPAGDKKGAGCNC